MQVLIVGGGQVGSYLAELLLGQGHAVTVVEAQAPAIAAIQRAVPGVRCELGGGTDPGALERAGIRAADVVAAVTGADETNLVIAGLARFAFGVPRTAARVNNPHNAWMFTPTMGVDAAFNQADLIARLIVQAVSG